MQENPRVRAQRAAGRRQGLRLEGGRRHRARRGRPPRRRRRGLPATRASARRSPPRRRSRRPARRPDRARGGDPAAHRPRAHQHRDRQQLYLSVRTVESHRAHIQQKLRRTTRADLVRYALDRGLLDTRPVVRAAASRATPDDRPSHARLASAGGPAQTTRPALTAIVIAHGVGAGRLALRMLVEAEPTAEVVAEATLATEAGRLARAHRADVLVLFEQLLRGGGAGLLPALLRRRVPRARGPSGGTRRRERAAPATSVWDRAADDLPPLLRAPRGSAVRRLSVRGHPHRQRDLQDRPCRRRRPHVERAVRQRDALAHADQAEARGTPALVEAPAVVAHDDRDGAVGLARPRSTTRSARACLTTLVSASWTMPVDRRLELGTGGRRRAPASNARSTVSSISQAARRRGRARPAPRAPAPSPSSSSAAGRRSVISARRLAMPPRDELEGLRRAPASSRSGSPLRRAADSSTRRPPSSCSVSSCSSRAQRRRSASEAADAARRIESRRDGLRGRDGGRRARGEGLQQPLVVGAELRARPRGGRRRQDAERPAAVAAAGRAIAGRARAVAGRRAARRGDRGRSRRSRAVASAARSPSARRSAPRGGRRRPSGTTPGRGGHARARRRRAAMITAVRASTQRAAALGDSSSMRSSSVSPPIARAISVGRLQTADRALELVAPRARRRGTGARCRSRSPPSRRARPWPPRRSSVNSPSGFSVR